MKSVGSFMWAFSFNKPSKIVDSAEQVVFAAADISHVAIDRDSPFL